MSCTLATRDIVYWEATKLEGEGQVKFYPYEKEERGGEVLVMLKGCTRQFEVNLVA